MYPSSTNDTWRLELAKVVVASVLYLSYRGMGGAGQGGAGRVNVDALLCTAKVAIRHKLIRI